MNSMNITDYNYALCPEDLLFFVPGFQTGGSVVCALAFYIYFRDSNPNRSEEVDNSSPNHVKP